ncbi:endo-1,4-beta-xylanase [Tellurirhabdus bombi]|uniref:endo-1,4-beta-xylanase n=1 Tax=Tellurirhabdus bombi TaxID=2907205 RepID=UPI001F2EB3CE|nr:endo-1,4-beta-xylanase [Tellurirhabdus bombi]
MKNHLKHILVLGLSAGIFACQPDEVNTLNLGNFSDTNGELKNAASFPVGLAIDYTPFVNDAKYRETVLREAKSITVGYHMKHGALVNNNGAIDFSKADQIYNLASAAGVEVFGHTLGWHANQNATYLKTLTAGSSSTGATNLATNGDFEQGTGGSFTGWSVLNGAASITGGTTAESRGGQRSLKATVAASGNPWSVQVASPAMATPVGKQFRISFWIKAQNANGKMRLSTTPNPQYSADYTIGTEWAQFSWTITSNAEATQVVFDLGSTANTYFIDDVTVTDPSVAPPATGAEIAKAVDNALNDFITKTVTHYKGKINAWDVVNEPMADGNGALRTNSNTTVPAGTTDFFFWSQYLGRNWGLKAFQYAAAADPAAELYINDYNLESNGVKLDSLIGYVNELKGKGAKIAGIGTQMHISVNTSYAGIDNAFKKLAATGLKVRISELDVRANPLDKGDFNPASNPQALAYQAVMYKYVVDSYMKHVPAAQRAGITIWGVTDADSWIVVNQKKLDFPLLFNANYEKKPAYSAVLQGLKGQ